jgi:hypothetical protein
LWKELHALNTALLNKAYDANSPIYWYNGTPHQRHYHNLSNYQTEAGRFTKEFIANGRKREEKHRREFYNFGRDSQRVFAVKPPEPREVVVFTPLEDYIPLTGLDAAGDHVPFKSPNVISETPSIQTDVVDSFYLLKNGMEIKTIKKGITLITGNSISLTKRSLKALSVLMNDIEFRKLACVILAASKLDRRVVIYSGVTFKSSHFEEMLKLLPNK